MRSPSVFVRFWVYPDRIQLLFDEVELTDCLSLSVAPTFNNGVHLVGVPDVIDVLGDVIW